MIPGRVISLSLQILLALVSTMIDGFEPLNNTLILMNHVDSMSREKPRAMDEQDKSKERKNGKRT